MSLARKCCSGHCFTSPTKRDRRFTRSSEPREGLTNCRAKAVTSFLSYFTTLRTGYFLNLRNILLGL